MVNVTDLTVILISRSDLAGSHRCFLETAPRKVYNSSTYFGRLKSSLFSPLCVVPIELMGAASHCCSALSSAAESSITIMPVKPYTGCLNNACPTTHKTFVEIETPVVFQWNPTQPYECAALAHWLRVRSRDPMTNLHIDCYCLMHYIVPLCGYSTVETVHTILGDLICKIGTAGSSCDIWKRLAHSQGLVNFQKAQCHSTNPIGGSLVVWPGIRPKQ